jgi:4-hydroxy-3-methylbut-2-enyl diphosphate reductase
VRIEIDKKSGFCTGVQRAVRLAEKTLGERDELNSLGPLVHNTSEVNRLEGMGLGSISYGEFNRLDHTPVLIRAHGEPPSTYLDAAERNIELIDATCPIVRRLQEKIRETYHSMQQGGGSILIFGKQDHPEVRALVGQTEGKAFIVRDPSDLETLDLQAPVALFSQTTMITSEFEDFTGKLKGYLSDRGMGKEGDLTVNNTICGQVSSREPHLQKFVSEFDLILFVSGRESSNGRALFEVCRQVNANSFFISDPAEAGNIDIEGIESIGICGATSTPEWQMEAVRSRILDRAKITSS